MWLLKYVSRQKVTNSILESPPCSNHLAFAPFNKALWKHGIIHLGLVGKKQYRITPAVVNQCHLITVLSSLTTINIGCWSTSIGCGCRWGTVGITFSAIRVHTIHEVHRSKAIKRKKPHSNIRSGSLSTWSSSIISFPTMRKHCRCMPHGIMGMASSLSNVRAPTRRRHKSLSRSRTSSLLGLDFDEQ